MKTKPILFSTPMVQAIINGTKTQTRRTKGLDNLNKNPDWFRYDGISNYIDHLYKHYFELVDLQGEPKEQYTSVDAYVKAGDILWVRETFADATLGEKLSPKTVAYKADYTNEENNLPKNKGIWKPSIFMPKEACRLWLKVTDVSVERLQDISEDDAIAEGARGSIPIDKLCKHVDRCKNRYMHETLNNMSGHQLGFLDIWADINGLEYWFANPWVWVYKFERCEMPKNFLS